MALIFLNQSLCPICNEVMKSTEATTGFSAFVINTLDPIYLFNDQGFHKSCAEGHPLYSKARVLYNLLDNQKTCTVDGGEIDTTKEHFFQTPVFSSDEQHPLYRFNCICVRSSNIAVWKDRSVLKELLEKALEYGNWVELDGSNRTIKSYIIQLD